VRGDFLEKVGRYREAADEFTLAASLTHNESEQQLMRQRAAKITRPLGPP
jgi:predicted RNA polymerase sigma factor